MSLFNQTMILYVLAGLGVAGAVYVTDGPATPSERWFRVLTAIPFWPLYLPLLLVRRPRCADLPSHAPTDEMETAIAQVETELEAALGSLEGWADEALAHEETWLAELRNAWQTLAQRIREMDRLLSQAEAEPQPLAAPLATNERLRQSHEARRQNLERLRQVRRRAYADLMASLAWVRELVSMIHLAKFTGAPAARAEELVAQIAAAVEGLSGVIWPDDPSAVAAGDTSIRE